jgi:hypothetical protein
VDDEPFGRDAALAGRLERREDRRRHGEIEIGVFRDHDRVLAAHLAGGELAGGAADFAGDPLPDLGAPREEDGVDDGRSGVAVPLHHVEHAVGDPRVDHQLRDGVGALRRLLCGFPDDGVALDQRDRHVPKRDGDREVPRRDAADDATGFAAHVGVLRRDLARHHVAVGVAGVAGRPLDHVGGLDDVGSPLADLLAALSRDEFAEFVGSVLELRVHVPEMLRAVDVGERAPLLEGRLGRLDRRGHVRLGSAGERPQRFAGRRVVTLERLCTLDPLAADVVSVHPHAWD